MHGRSNSFLYFSDVDIFYNSNRDTVQEPFKVNGIKDVRQSWQTLQTFGMKHSQT